MDRLRTKGQIMTEDFLMRTVTKKSGIFEVSRMRNSNGFSSISVKINDKESFRFDTDGFGPEYELKAKELSDLLIDITENPCLLPKSD